MIQQTEQVTPQIARIEKAKRAGLRSYETFFRTYPPKEEYIFGYHTTFVLNEFDDAIKKVEQGENVYLIINMPFRHGKSDMGPRRLPPWVFIRNPEWEIILASYNYDLASEMSLDARRCFREIGPIYDQFISTERDQAGCWKLRGGGACYATGIGGTITGRGAHILLIDDFLKNREEAESEIVRNKGWDCFPLPHDS